jgi:hypothetical protein
VRTAVVRHLLKGLPLPLVRGLGGQLGQHVQEAFGITIAGASLPLRARRLHSLSCIVVPGPLYCLDPSLNGESH